MKARIKPRLTDEENKALEHKIREECIEQTKKYEMEIDTVTLYILHTEFGFGIGRLEKFYDLMFERRKEMQEFFQSDRYDAGMAEHAMRYKLRQDGIDVEDMYRKRKSRFTIRVSK